MGRMMIIGLFIIMADIHDIRVMSLEPGANHVIEITWYTKEKTSFLLVFSQYKSKRNVRYECETGWFSKDDIACDYPICNGKTSLNGACNEKIPNSHIVYSDGSVQSYPEGTCSRPNACTCTKKGFYALRGICDMCSPISNCDLETCTSGINQICERCEGVVFEEAGKRAYVKSSDRKNCNKACSWRSDSRRCYPGTCQNELYSRCTCSQGFSGLHCSTITEKPVIKNNELTLTSSGGSNVNAPYDVNAGPSAAQSDRWTNLVDPASLTYKFESEFRPTLPSSYPAYITDAKIGIISGRVVLTSKNKQKTVLGSALTRTCSGASRTSPERNQLTCQGTLAKTTASASFPIPFQHGNSLSYSFFTENGGFVKVKNWETNLMETHFYTANSVTHAFELHFDTVNPYHCTGTAACVEGMLSLSDILMTSEQTLRWSNWKDDDAGIDYYKYFVYELHQVAGQLKHKSLVHTGQETGSASTSTFTLNESGMYAVVFTPHDRATNHKSARRLFLFDPSSEITKNTSDVTPLRVTSAAPVTSWRWQHTEGEVRVTWNQRYANLFHHHNHLLAGVAAEVGVDSDYDDNEGVRNVTAVENVLGIVRFDVAFGVDNKGGSTLTLPPNAQFAAEPDLSGSKTFQPDVKDGDTLTLWVRAYDLRDEYLEESVTVHVDSSPPVLRDLWLTRDHVLNVSVHGMHELHEMTIEWEAFDPHSGLKEVQWRVIDTFYGEDIVHGIAHVSPQGNTQDLAACQSTYSTYPRGSDCYCTGPEGCFHRHFQVRPSLIDNATHSHGGVYHTSNTANHDFDYVLEVTVYNHANLSTTLRRQITVDLSPPHPGQVHDGRSGSPEVDHQAERELHAHWSGFFDKESGVKFYQVAFDTQCLPASAFSHNTQDPRVNQTEDTFFTWTAPADDTYYVTVVAFNSAIEPSAPVCSDGVTVDSTGPVITNFYVAGARVAGGIVSVRSDEQDQVWLVDKQRRRRKVDNPDQACIDKATQSTEGALAQFAEIRVTGPLDAASACVKDPLDPKFLNKFYLSSDSHLFLNWTGSDAESGIYDYEVGLASTSNPEVGDISAYTSSGQHNFYHSHHPALDSGSPFYILVSGTNKAVLSTDKVLGPATLVRTPASYSGPVTLNLTSDLLMVTWELALFTDVEPQHLRFSVQLEEETSGAILSPHAQPQSSGPCQPASPPTCATFDPADLDWHLHQRHVYRAKVIVTNIVDLDLHLTSNPYVHDTRLAARGSVFDVVPEGEESTLGVERSDDTDYQLSTSQLEARWSGFEDGSQQITYSVGLRRLPEGDDVTSFVNVSTDLEHKFTGLSLEVGKRYFVTVVARSGVGNVTVSSDGVTVIQAGQAESEITVKDGPVCVTRNDDESSFAEHHNDLPLVPCEDDVSFQTSKTVLQAHWDMTSEQRHRYPDVRYKVEKNVPGTVAWPAVTDYAPSSRNDVIVAHGLPLETGTRYRLAVKFCVSGACSLPVYSSGVYVITRPPATGAVKVEHSNDTGTSQLHVKLELFRDPDVPTLTSAQAAILGYQWNLAHRRHDNTLAALGNWTDVDTIATLNSTHGEFTLSLPGHLSFHKCLVLMVRGINKVGMVSLATADVMDCAAFDPALVVPLAVLDAVGEFPDGSTDRDLKNLQFNYPYKTADRDYTPHNDVISATWPKLRHSHVTWAVIESQGPDVTSHFGNRARQASTDACSLPFQIACGNVTDKRLINVAFGSSASRPLLQHGRHYYVCIFAKGETLVYEKGKETLPDVTGCSDGVTVDMTSPQGGSVRVKGLNNDLFQTSLSVLSVSWSGFRDVEELGGSAHSSGIQSYRVSVGSQKGGEDLSPSKAVGLVNSVTLHSLNMQDGHVYFVTVTARDHVGLTVAVSSEGFVVDSTPPVTSARHFRFPQPYVTSASLISLCWSDIFNDAESGIDHYVISVGSRPGHYDVMLRQNVKEDCGEFRTDVEMINGHSYYVNVGAVNGAGLETLLISKPMAAMTTTPSSGHVYDGPAESADVDLDFVTSSEGVAAHWSGFSTPMAPMTSYYVRLGTCPGCDDVVPELDIGLSTNTSWSHAPLRHDIRYYTSVRACNAVDQCHTVTSDGVMIDVTPPVTGTVWDGAGDDDITYQSQRDFLAAQWRAFIDLGSGISGFTWRAGTAPGGNDVMAERDVGLTYSAFTSSLPGPLPIGKRVYITVKATDAAGNTQEAHSNGFTVDSSPPLMVKDVELTPGAASLDDKRLVSSDSLSVRWSMTDPESQVAVQYLSIRSHLAGEFQSRSTKIPGPLTNYTFTSLNLHDGNVYNVKVTACNMARLCTTSVTADILHDNSPPSTGMLAVSTDHSAELQRHVNGWMTWGPTNVRLAWLGFHDEHSGIHGYHISVGSAPYGHDLNAAGSSLEETHVSTNVSEYSHQDEGFVQVLEVPTEALAANQIIFVTIWAANGVGLKSHPSLSELQLLDGGTLALIRRCSPFNCLSHCACATQGDPCEAATSCVQYTEANNPNSKLTVKDHANLSHLHTDSTSKSPDLYQVSQSYLAASWHVTTPQGLQPIRFEVSAGRSNLESPVGVFNEGEERVWRDVGLSTSSVQVIPKDTKLSPSLAYSTFVRTWYSDGSHAVFKSSGITPVSNRPSTTNQVGRAVKEHSATSGSKDVDFVTSSDFLSVTWTDHFVDSHPLSVFQVYIGSQTEAGDIYASEPLPGTTKHLNMTALSLEENTVYYTTVITQGVTGLQQWGVSDGFLLDTTPPGAGLVMDGRGLEDADYQSSADKVSASWRGFHDTASGVRHYFWCVGSTSDSTLCDVKPWTDVGVMTSGSAVLLTPVAQGSKLFSKVYAEDWAGHRSDVAVSDGVTVDVTAPQALTMVYSQGLNLLDNPSFELDTANNAPLTLCDQQPPSSWQITEGSCVTLHRPQHTVASHGHQHAVLSGTLHQTLTDVTPGAVYRLTLRLAHPHNALANQKAVTGHVTMGSVTTPFELDPSLCRGLCDSGEEKVMLWHRFTFVETATSHSLRVSISTTVTSSDQQVAVDDVSLEEIRQVAAGDDTSAAPGVATSGVFLPQWSVVQTSWHFTEDVSPIVDYQWALGSSRGGVQLQGFRSVGRRQHAAITGLSLTHNASLYVTVMARNAAGMTSVAYSSPLTVDMTPPEILSLWDGAEGGEVDFQTEHVIAARWSVLDQESAVEGCQWAIGTVPGRGDLLPFHTALSPDSTAFSVSSDITSALESVILPVKVYVSVRCFNRAGLPARAVTNGVTILETARNGEGPPLRILPDSLTQYPVADSCHARTDYFRLMWEVVQSSVPVSGFQITSSTSGGQSVFTTPAHFPYLLESAVLQGVPGQTTAATATAYNITVSPVHIFGGVGSGSASAVTDVLPKPPVVAANQTLASSVSGTDLTLTWPNLFQSTHDLYYEVTAGAVRGGGDITLWQRTRDSSVVISLAEARQTAFDVNVVVTAVDPCGQFITYTGVIAVTLES